MQVVSVIILTVGIILTASSSQRTPGLHASETSFNKGFAILFCAQILSAFMGLLTEATYRQFGPNWRENLFYTVG